MEREVFFTKSLSVVRQAILSQTEFTGVDNLACANIAQDTETYRWTGHAMLTKGSITERYNVNCILSVVDENVVLNGQVSIRKPNR